MHSFYRQAAVGFEQIIKTPGVWDPFVICYVDVRAHLTYSTSLPSFLMLVQNFADCSEFSIASIKQKIKLDVLSAC